VVVVNSVAWLIDGQLFDGLELCPAHEEELAPDQPEDGAVFGELGVGALVEDHLAKGRRTLRPGTKGSS
jgi:hypothetical protein